MAGVCEALIAKKIEKYPPLTNKWKFSLEMFAITHFAELLVSPHKKIVDLTKIPQDIRTWLCRSLDKFGDGVKILILGTGSGGVVPEAFSDTVMKGREDHNYILFIFPK